LKNKGQTDEETELLVDKNQNKSQDKSKESIADKWSEFLKKLENQNHVLAMKIKHAEFKFDNNEIKLIYNGGASLYADSVREGILEIQGLLKEFIHDVKITIHEKEIKRKDINQEAINNPLVKQALQLFEGRIYKITPKKGGNNV
jgi:DNA polymerase-3 subunit gamma/tau